MSTKQVLLSTCAALGVALSAGMATAQSAAPTPATQSVAPAPSQQPSTIETVTVTAEKRSTAIEKTPAAITAFTAEQRDILGIATTQQLSDFTPGLSYFASNDRSYIRGVGRNTVNLAAESGVATYYNGIYYGANASIAEQHDSLFIGNIEVDRGPQNTLHGSNADGGTINYVSQAPTDSFYAEARAGAGNYGEYHGEAVVSGPITDWLRFRTGGSYSSESGGFFNNVDGPHEGGTLAQAQNGNQKYYELQLDANLGPNLDAWGIVSTSDYDTSFHTTSTSGIYNNYTFSSGTLSPTGFFGLCGLPSEAANIGCTGAPAMFAGGPPMSVVPGSLVSYPFNAAAFPGNNPANVNERDFLQNYVDTNRQMDDLSLATRWTYHFPTADLQYLGGYQQFSYHLGLGNQSGPSGVGDSGLVSYDIAGLPTNYFGTDVAALSCAAIGAPAAACAAPLTIYPGQAHATFVEEEQYFSHELTLTSTDSGPVQWIGGLYWYHEHYDQPINGLCFPQQPQLLHPFTFTGPAAANPQMCEFDQDTHMTYDSYAGFGQVTWQVADDWRLEAAARYTRDEKSGIEGTRVIGFADTALGLPYFGAATPAIDITELAISFAPTPGAGTPFENSQTGFWERQLKGSWGGLTGEVTLNWTPDESTLAYAKYSRGYKTGGFNSGSLSSEVLTAPEYVDAYEVGAKKTVGSQFQINGAAFYYNYLNEQQPVSIPSPAGVPVSDIFNVPSAHTYGLELEAVWQPIDPLMINAQYTYLNSTVASMDGKCFENTVDPLAILPGSNRGACPVVAGIQEVDLTGSHLPETPPNKVSVNANYTFTFESGHLLLGASYIWKDRTFGSIFNNPQALAPAYSQVNLSAEWDDAQDRYTIRGWVNNVFNTTGYDIVTPYNLAPAGLPYDIVSAKSLTFPITFGAELRVRFH
jgi:iron complex outermembrane receptor protein